MDLTSGGMAPTHHARSKLLPRLTPLLGKVRTMTRQGEPCHLAHYVLDSGVLEQPSWPSRSPAWPSGVWEGG